MCTYVSVMKKATATHHPQTNGPAITYSWKSVFPLRLCISHHHRTWYEYVQALVSVASCRPYQSTKKLQLLELSRYSTRSITIPNSLAVQNKRLQRNRSSGSAQKMFARISKMMNTVSTRAKHQERTHQRHSKLKLCSLSKLRPGQPAFILIRSLASFAI